MAKLKQAAAAASPVVPGAPAVPVAPVLAPAVQSSPMPFSPEPVTQPSKPAAGGQSIVQKRKARIEAAVASGSPFTFKEFRSGPFTCICGATGKNALVLLDKNNVEVLVGSNCVKHANVTLPTKERKPRAEAPGVSRQQKLAETLGKYKPPYHFVRKQEGPFACLCGGRGTNQIVVADANGAEFSVGNTCAAAIPGVEIPKPPKKEAPAKVAGLKGAVESPKAAPSFTEVG